jgi:hypothetical protein
MTEVVLTIGCKICDFSRPISWYILHLFFVLFNATFSNFSAISWRPVLVVEEAGVPV